MYGSKRCYLWLIVSVCAGLVGCSGLPGADQAAEFTDEQVVDFLRASHPLIADIPTIPLPQELADRQEPYVQDVLGILEKVNSFAGLVPPLASGVPKVVQQSQSASGWKRECHDLPRPVCIFTRSRGGLTITIWHEDIGEYWMWWEEWDGCDGTHEYADYLVQRKFMGKDAREAIWEGYQYPDPPLCDGGGGGEIGPGPSFTYHFEVEGDGTLYSPWGDVQLQVRRYTTVAYRYRVDVGAYLPNVQHLCEVYPDGRMVFEIWRESVSTPGLLYLDYRGTWSDLRYCWQSFREDGMMDGCGGDMGCPECGP